MDRVKPRWVLQQAAANIPGMTWFWCQVSTGEGRNIAVVGTAACLGDALTAFTTVQCKTCGLFCPLMFDVLVPRRTGEKITASCMGLCLQQSSRSWARPCVSPLYRPWRVVPTTRRTQSVHTTHCSYRVFGGQV